MGGGGLPVPVGAHPTHTHLPRSRREQRGAIAGQGLPFPGLPIVSLLDGLISSSLQLLSPQAPAGSRKWRWRHCLLHFLPGARPWLRGGACMPVRWCIQGRQGSPQVGILLLGTLLLRIEVVAHHLLQRQGHGRADIMGWYTMLC